VADLPTDPTIQCDGTTLNPLFIPTDALGNFSAQYTISQLTNAGGSPITCDATDYCVLWVGVDVNSMFLSGAHGFSAPFEVGAPPTGTPETPATIALPLVAAGLVGGALWVARRRRVRSSVVT
jgi:hypothetical protein